MGPSLNALLCAALTFTSIALGAPAPTGASVDAKDKHFVSADAKFSVEQVKNPNYVRNGAVALAKAYNKFNAPLPESLKEAVTHAKSERRDTGSATATPEANDLEYLTPVQIGTPAQTLNLDFDTGSSDLWVFSTETASSDVNGQSLYNPTKSSTAKKLSGYSWSISYGDGSSSSGDVYTDKVSVGGLVVTAQAVEAAQTVSDSFTSETNLDGLLGLAFSSINTVEPRQQTTFFDTAASKLTSRVFTADLKHSAPGKYNFGYIDSSAYTGAISYVPVDSSQGFWEFKASGYAVGSAALSSTSIDGIADTGTTLLLLPASIVRAYYAQVSGAQNSNSAGGYIFPCSATLPSFSFGVGSSRFTIPGKYINYAPVSRGSSSCFGGLQSSAGIGINIFGDIALKAGFVVFDGGNKRLGWAAKTLS
ncbi:Endothiapepsin [Paramyrothecium foliicola]|nr:Endothiapepsin [Paramyrothecium foliicola]